MTIPKQAADAGKKADDLLKKAAEDVSTPTEDPTKDADPAKDKDKDIIPKKEDEELDLDTLLPKPTDDKDGDFATKYSVLQGKYNAEVPALYKQISELKVQLADLQAQLVTSKAPSKDVTTIPKSLEYLRKEMPEFEDAVNYLADMKVKEILAAHMGDVNTKVENLSTRVAANTESAFYRHLDDNVKQWRVINEHPSFAAWLQKVDPRTGIPLSAILQDAYTQFDGQRASAIFNEFITEVKSKSKGKSPMEPFTAPDNLDTDNTPPEDKKITISREDIKQFYADVAKGLYKHNPEEMKKREAEINKVVAAGKVA